MRDSPTTIGTPPRLTPATYAGVLAAQGAYGERRRVRLPQRIVQPFSPLAKEIYERGVKVITADLIRHDPRLKDSGFITESQSQRGRVGEDAFEGLLTKNGTSRASIRVRHPRARRTAPTMPMTMATGSLTVSISTVAQVEFVPEVDRRVPTVGPIRIPFNEVATSTSLVAA